MEQNKSLSMVTVIFFTWTAAFSSMLISPALPDISTFFHIDDGKAQFLITAFFFGFAAGQLFFGPLANALGRRITMSISVLLGCFGGLISLLSSYIHSYDLFIFGRVIEGIGASGCCVIAILLVNECFDYHKARRLMAYVMMSYAIAPAMAILLGGFIAQYMKWRVCLIVFVLYSIFLLIKLRQLPETLSQRDLSHLKIKSILMGYKKVFLNSRLLRYSLMSGFSSSNSYVFFAAAPFIALNYLHIHPAEYGSLALIPYVGALIGGLLMTRLLNRSNKFILVISFCLGCTGIALMLVSFLINNVTLFWLFFPMILYMGAHCILGSISVAAANQQGEDKACASAATSFSGLAVVFMMTLILGAIDSTVAWVLPVLMSGSMIFILFLFISLLRGEGEPDLTQKNKVSLVE